jgi:Asp-tRNA(Asn)/Glu-tRNA(Gln) amidotransferase C subunit
MRNWLHLWEKRKAMSSASSTIQSLVKLAELLESKGLTEYAKQIEEIIEAVAEDKMTLDNSGQEENKE